MTNQVIETKVANRANAHVIIIALLSIALVISPPLSSLISCSSCSSGVIFESSIFSADYAHLFREILFGHSVWLWGQYQILPINYVPLYIVHWTLENFLGSNLVAYLVMVMLAQVSALGAFVALCEAWARQCPETGSPTFRRVSAWLLGTAFLTSLANFNYLKSNVLFALPYYSLPIQLLLIEHYLTSRNRRILLGLMAVVLIMNTFNLTHFIYIQGTVLGYAYIFSRRNVTWETVKVDWRAVAWAGLAFAPAAILVGGTWIVNLPYYGSLSQVGSIMAENMYSQNAGILQGLLQITDWGLFGRFNGELNYKYSPYYLHALSRLAGLVLPAAVVLLALLGLNNKEKRSNRLVLFWGLIALACLFFLMGKDNLLFAWLYEKVFLFQIFRNITKLSAMLVFSLVSLAFLFSLGNGMRATKHLVLLVAIIGAFAYNLPYWLNADYFFRDRSVREIPRYWYDAGDFLASRALPGSRVLMLPATYINDIYFWDKKKDWVQGNLADAIWPVRTYRLSEKFIGPPRMQREMKKVFVEAPSLPRGLSVNLDALESFARDNGFDFLVLTRDLVDDYRFVGSFESWANRAGFTKLAKFGAITVFNNLKNYRPPISANVDFTYSHIDHLTYRLTLKNVKGPVSLVFQDAYRPGWRLAADARNADLACAERCPPTPLFFYFTDIALAFHATPFADKHFALPDGSNIWILDINSLRSRLPPGSIHENADGSLDVSLVIHFAPQLAFIIMVWMFIASLVICVVVYGVARRPNDLNA